MSGVRESFFGGFVMVAFAQQCLSLSLSPAHVQATRAQAKEGKQ